MRTSLMQISSRSPFGDILADHRLTDLLPAGPRQASAASSTGRVAGLIRIPT